LQPIDALKNKKLRRYLRSSRTLSRYNEQPFTDYY
jgi:hypothetical protein